MIKNLFITACLQISTVFACLSIIGIGLAMSSKVDSIKNITELTIKAKLLQNK